MRCGRTGRSGGLRGSAAGTGYKPCDLGQALGRRTLELMAAVQELGFDIFTSEPLIEELRSVLGRAKLRKQMLAKALTISGVLGSYLEMTQVIEPDFVGRVTAVPDDDVVLGTAKAARADLIVSGDQNLLVLEQFEDMPIMTVAEALVWVERA